MRAAVLSAVAILPLALAVKTHHVIVGGIGKLLYTPEYVHAAVGDRVVFEFQQKNHSATQSSFDNPCTPWPSGFDSGFFPVADDLKSGFPMWDVEVKGHDPIWVHCRQTAHCAQGMVFAINPPATGNTFQAFKGKATVNTVKEHFIQVGGAPGNVYTPSWVDAKKGDKVIFQFRQKNHTVTQSSFDNPCRKLEFTSQSGEKGFDSDFQPVAPEVTTGFPTWNFTVPDDTKPIWAYCRQTGHCGQGMVFAINPSKGGKAFDDFKHLAIKINGTAATTPPPPATHPAAAVPPAPTPNPSHHWVEVGGPNGNVYKPHYVNAKKGDKITFQFKEKNHTVTQSTFDYPCRKIELTTQEKGFDSGFMPVAAGTTNFPVWDFVVHDDSRPIWAYCQQGNHCRQGMVFAINPGKNGDDFEDFVENAINPDDVPDDDGTPGKTAGGSHYGPTWGSLPPVLQYFAGRRIDL